MKISLIILIMTISCSNGSNCSKVEVQALKNISVIDESIEVEYDESFREREIKEYIFGSLEKR